MPVDLAYVEDQQISRILSKAVRKYMDVIFVKSSEISHQLYSKRIKCLSLDQTRRYRIQNRFRTEQEMNDRTLPLPSLQNVRGEPKYMVIIDY